MAHSASILLAPVLLNHSLDTATQSGRRAVMKNLLFISFLLVAFFTAPDGWCQPLSAEELTGAMESAPVRESFDKCAEGKPRPSIVTLKITVSEKGEMKLISSDPALDPGLMVCFEAVVSSIKLRDVGIKYVVEYSLTLPQEDAAAAPQPAAPAAGAPPAGPAGPQTAAPLAQESGTPAGAGAAQTPVDASWESEWNAGRRMMAAGIALTVAGGALALGTGLFAVIAILDCFFPSSNSVCYALSNNAGVIVVTALSGVAVLGLGIGLLVAGIVKKHRASRMKRSLAAGTFGIGPTPAGDGFSASLILRF
jgi:hypothetical protein